VADPSHAWVWIALAVSLLAGTAVLVCLFRSKGRPAGSTTDFDPRAEALDRLHVLKRDYFSIQPIDFGARAVDALRLVLAHRFGPGSLNLTSDEFFERHGSELGDQIGAEQAGTLAGLLATCDRLRFAPDPDAPSLREPLATDAIAFVRDIPSKVTPTTEPPAITENDARPAAA
jgi:hypothetical protein